MMLAVFPRWESVANDSAGLTQPIVTHRGDEQIQGEPGEAFGALSGEGPSTRLSRDPGQPRAPVRVLRFVTATQLPPGRPCLTIRSGTAPDPMTPTLTRLRPK
jgi:hypothetical protein